MLQGQALILASSVYHSTQHRKSKCPLLRTVWWWCSPGLCNGRYTSLCSVLQSLTSPTPAQLVLPIPSGLQHATSSELSQADPRLLKSLCPLPQRFNGTVTGYVTLQKRQYFSSVQAVHDSNNNAISLLHYPKMSPRRKKKAQSSQWGPLDCQDTTSPIPQRLQANKAALRFLV